MYDHFKCDFLKFAVSDLTSPDNSPVQELSSQIVDQYDLTDPDMVCIQIVW